MVYYNEICPFAAEWLRNLIKAGLLPDGVVDDRPIQEVRSEDVVGFIQRHWFAGVGGWPLALRLAGWPDDRPCDTGSCPCQGHSVAGKKKGKEDERHLWPEFYRLVRELRPPVIFGEQVASSLAREWADEVGSDLERSQYEFALCDLPAAAIGAPHIRQRFFWCARLAGEVDQGFAKKSFPGQLSGVPSPVDDEENPSRKNDSHLEGDEQGQKGEEDEQDEQDDQRGYHGLASHPDSANSGLLGLAHERARCQQPEQSGQPREQAEGHGLHGSLAHLHGDRQPQRGQPHGQPEQSEQSASRRADAGGRGADADQLGNTSSSTSQRDTRWFSGEETESDSQWLSNGCVLDRFADASNSLSRHNFWDDFLVAHCTDGKSRRIPTQPELFPLAHGLPGRNLEPLLAWMERLGYSRKDARRLLRLASRNRTGQLKGAGNGIVVPLAVEFIKAFLEAEKGEV